MVHAALADAAQLDRDVVSVCGRNQQLHHGKAQKLHLHVVDAQNRLGLRLLHVGPLVAVHGKGVLLELLATAPVQKVLTTAIVEHFDVHVFCPHEVSLPRVQVDHSFSVLPLHRPVFSKFGARVLGRRGWWRHVFALDFLLRHRELRALLQVHHVQLVRGPPPDQGRDLALGTRGGPHFLVVLPVHLQQPLVVHFLHAGILRHRRVPLLRALLRQNRLQLLQSLVFRHHPLYVAIAFVLLTEKFRVVLLHLYVVWIVLLQPAQHASGHLHDHFVVCSFYSFLLRVDDFEGPLLGLTAGRRGRRAVFRR
mmetsp:Transcript_25133/g.63261  ORF Transcript_25133/g.63261 Transcript_25133/m.63261 type:complete len:308 (+) Transcript_25133:937-1860(+)